MHFGDLEGESQLSRCNSPYSQPSSIASSSINDPVINLVTKQTFEGLDPKIVFEVLCALTDSELDGRQGIVVSHKKLSYDKLNDGQLMKMHKVYANLTEPQKNMVLDKVRTRLSRPLEHGEDLRTITTKNDKIRILELSVYPGARILWDRAFNPMDRQTLDAAHSHVSDAQQGDLSAWNGLAAIFNDRTEVNPFQPHNRALDTSGLIKLSVLNLLGTLDPNEHDRPLRDGKWLKTHYSQMRTEISQIAENFGRSGNQGGCATSSNGIEDWVINFAAGQATKGGQHMQYAILVVDVTNIAALGKVLPYGRDSGKPPLSRNIAKQDQRKRAKLVDSSSGHGQSNEEDPQTTELLTSLQTANRLSVLQTIATGHYDEEKRKKAMDALADLAGL
jgi:hypothetical protein